MELERAAITGMVDEGPEPRLRAQSIDALVDELAGHLRAILRDTLCGPLAAAEIGLADELLAEAAQPLVAGG